LAKIAVRLIAGKNGWRQLRMRARDRENLWRRRFQGWSPTCRGNRRPRLAR